MDILANRSEPASPVGEDPRDDGVRRQDPLAQGVLLSSISIAGVMVAL